MLRSIVRRVTPRFAWTALRLLRIRFGVASYRVHNVRHVYGDLPLTVLLTDPLAEGWYDRDWPVLHELVLLRKGRLREGATVFDLGAHQAVVAMQLAAIVGPTGRVIAVEANAHNAAVAQANADRNGFAQLRICHAAVSDSPGMITVSRSLNAQVDNGSGEWGRTEVSAVTIDELMREHGRPDVLFVDVEGFECHALRGAEECLKSLPDCFVEVHADAGLEKLGGSVAALLKFFPREHYDVYIAPEEGAPFDRTKVDQILPTKRFFLVALSKTAPQ